MLRQLYRHNIPDHGDVFAAIVVLTQLSINAGEKLFRVGYKDPPYDSDEDDHYVNTAYNVASDDDDDDDDDDE